MLVALLALIQLSRGLKIWIASDDPAGIYVRRLTVEPTRVEQVWSSRLTGPDTRAERLLVSPNDQLLFLEGSPVYDGVVQHWDVFLKYSWPKGPLLSTMTMLDTTNYRVLRQWKDTYSWRERMDDASLTLYNYEIQKYSSKPTPSKCTIRTFKAPSWTKTGTLRADIFFASDREDPDRAKAAQILNERGLTVPFSQVGRSDFDSSDNFIASKDLATIIAFARPRERRHTYKTIGAGDIFVLRASDGYKPVSILTVAGCREFYFLGQNVVAFIYHPESDFTTRIRIVNLESQRTLWDGQGERLAAVGIPPPLEEKTRNLLTFPRGK